jgi:hypothetical protein
MYDRAAADEGLCARFGETNSILNFDQFYFII